MAWRSAMAGTVLFALVNVASSGEGNAAGGANAVPPNFRQLIVQRILDSTNPRSIRRARISKPHQQWAGLFGGGERPTICVEVIRQTVLTSSARDVWAFTFHDGQIATASYTNADCGDYSPFDELLRKK